MKEYFLYFLYVIKHKWYVFWACVQNGIWWRGLLHDLSKFYPSEFFAYAKIFYGKIKLVRDINGYYDPYLSTNKVFTKSWISHLHRNKHHWQYFALVDENMSVVLMEMPKVYIIEMISDWIGATKAQKSKLGVIQWYRVYKNKILLHQNSKRFLESKLEEIFKEKI